MWPPIATLIKSLDQQKIVSAVDKKAVPVEKHASPLEQLV